MGRVLCTGSLRVLWDSSPDASIGNAVSFEDGEELMVASVSNLTVLTGMEPSQFGDLQFTGGSLFPLLSSGGVGRFAYNSGTFALSGCSPLWPGQVACSESELTYERPTQTLPRTWGAIKSMYR